jgi:hypothetical protein
VVLCRDYTHKPDDPDLGQIWQNQSWPIIYGGYTLAACSNWGVISVNTMSPPVKKLIGKCLEWVA